jgi:hypothetical protein
MAAGLRLIDVLNGTECMTASKRQKWERVRAKGHSCFIWRSFLLWGIPMCAVQIFGSFLYDMLTHKPYAPFQIFPSPVWSFVFDLLFWIFGFGYLTGEVIWQKQERDYQKITKDDSAV